MSDRLFIYMLRATMPPTVREHPLGDSFTVTPVRRPDSRTPEDLAYEDRWRQHYHQVFRRRAAYRRHRMPDEPVRVTMVGSGESNPLLEFEKPFVWRGTRNPAARKLWARIKDLIPDDSEFE